MGRWPSLPPPPASSESLDDEALDIRIVALEAAVRVCVGHSMDNVIIYAKRFEEYIKLGV